MPSSTRFAAVEAGGTKCICAIRSQDGALLERVSIPTRSPEATFADMKGFFADAAARHGAPAGTGLASFGPIELDPSAPGYGRIGGTPKPGWSGFDMLGAVAEATGTRVALDTDVNAAALGEGLLGAANDVDDYAYVTVGTGIGVGVVLGREVRSAFPHVEMGHIRVPRAVGDTFEGCCPFHHDCLEGLACGPAMQARWKLPAEALGAEHLAWQFASHYIAALCISLTYGIRVQRIILGGGVMDAPLLLDRVRADFTRMLGDYAVGPWAASPESFLVAPKLIDPSPALVGAFEMARRSIAAASSRPAT